MERIGDGGRIDAGAIIERVPPAQVGELTSNIRVIYYVCPTLLQKIGMKREKEKIKTKTL